MLSLRIKHLLARFVVQAKQIRFHDFPIVILKCSLGLTRHFRYFLSSGVHLAIFGGINVDS